MDIYNSQSDSVLLVDIWTVILSYFTTTEIKLLVSVCKTLMQAARQVRPYCIISRYFHEYKVKWVIADYQNLYIFLTAPFEVIEYCLDIDPPNTIFKQHQIVNIVLRGCVLACSQYDPYNKLLQSRNCLLFKFIRKYLPIGHNFVSQKLFIKLLNNGNIDIVNALFEERICCFDSIKIITNNSIEKMIARMSSTNAIEFYKGIFPSVINDSLYKRLLYNLNMANTISDNGLSAFLKIAIHGDLTLFSYYAYSMSYLMQRIVVQPFMWRKYFPKFNPIIQLWVVERGLMECY
jgi:hypothetical protein